eukprot:TRINITY_DN49599_c0_g1_i1.p1 TRINITY_DN49599_c0_g1~~TRINITY_DN49599_c0_g1_i1.p1  ORF type:complete len:230 (+),score=34.81 TRINITY_DN49599_c0_g1_i1:1-690(+)
MRNPLVVRDEVLWSAQKAHPKPTVTTCLCGAPGSGQDRVAAWMNRWEDPHRVYHYRATSVTFDGSVLDCPEDAEAADSVVWVFPRGSVQGDPEQMISRLGGLLPSMRLVAVLGFDDAPTSVAERKKGDRTGEQLRRCVGALKLLNASTAEDARSAAGEISRGTALWMSGGVPHCAAHAMACKSTGLSPGRALLLDWATQEHRSELLGICLLYTSPSPRDRTRSRMPSSA